MSYQKTNYVEMTPEQAVALASRLLDQARRIQESNDPNKYVYVHSDQDATNDSMVAFRISKKGR